MPCTEIFDKIKNKEIRLQDIPYDERDESYCRLAMRFSDDDVWKYIPNDYKTEQTLARWLNGSRADDLFPRIDKQFKNEVLLTLLIEKQWLELKVKSVISDFIPTINAVGDKTLDHWLKSAPWLFPYIMPEQMTYTRVKAIVRKRPQILAQIPNDLIDEALCVEAATCISALKYVPDEFRTQRVYDAALELPMVYHAQDIMLVPEAMFSKSIAEKLVMDSPYNLEFIPKKYITKTLCVSMFNGREFMGFMLNHIASLIPEEYRDEVMQKADFNYHVQPGELD